MNHNVPIPVVIDVQDEPRRFRATCPVCGWTNGRWETTNACAGSVRRHAAQKRRQEVGR